MTYDKLKKGIISMAIALSFIGVFGFVDNTLAQGRWRDRWEERQEREALRRIRRLDRDRMLRYSYRGRNRYVGYYDRWGRFHAVGFYDRFGRFHSYL